MKDRARQLGEQLRAESGVASAVRELESIAAQR
jgi:hypothetical protein